MKLYFVNPGSCWRGFEAYKHVNVLLSLAYAGRDLARVRKHQWSVMVDSGAYTFHTKGGIAVDEWLRLAQGAIVPTDEVVSLDVIGDARRTWDNYQIIKSVFPDAIPTFHLGSDLAYLKRYVDLTDRVAIGGMVIYKADPEKMFRELDRVFRLFSPSTLPRLHGFGMTNLPVITRYPFYSVDSSTWVNGSKYGLIKSTNGDITKRNALKRAPTTDVVATLISTYDERSKHNIKFFLDLEQEITSLWAARGITWNR